MGYGPLLRFDPCRNPGNVKWATAKKMYDPQAVFIAECQETPCALLELLHGSNA
jgi:hypothetical protein